MTSKYKVRDLAAPLWAIICLIGVVGCGSSPATNAGLVAVKVAFGGPIASGNGKYNLSGSYSGELPADQTLVIVAQRGDDYAVLLPPAVVDRGNASWLQPGIMLATPGNWRLHVCLIPAARAIMLAADRADHQSSLPEGARSLETVNILVPESELAAAPLLPASPAAPSQPAEPGSGLPPVAAAPTTAKETSQPRSAVTVVEPPVGYATFCPETVPLADTVVARWTGNLELLHRQSQFGIWRAEQPKAIQSIEERPGKVEIGPGRGISCLKLHYEVPGPGSYNGFWAKLGQADWSSLAGGNIVVRLGLGDVCTRSFKIELKSVNAQQPFPFYRVELSDAQAAATQRDGFFDVEIPLQDFVMQGLDLGQLDEFVLVFENEHVDKVAGDLLLHSVRLSPPPQAAPAAADSVLQDLALRAFRWFEANRDATTGLVLDRGPNMSAPSSRPRVCSIASVGYYLSMLPAAVAAGHIERAEAESRAELALAFMLEKMDHRHGMFHHFVDVTTGKPLADTEVSLLDSAILFNGAMVASESFGGRVQQLADTLFDRADWTAFVTKHPTSGKPLLAMGWAEKKGLLGPIDVRSSEMAMPCFLAVGSRTHPVDPQLWYNTTVVRGKVADRELLNPKHPLFTSYYGLAWHSLAGLVDREGVDLEANAREAALANRDFCQKLSSDSKTYASESGGWWGISAGDSPTGYIAPGLIRGDANGTVWPMTALAAAPWLPEEDLQQDLLAWQKSAAWRLVNGPYGLAPFNVDHRWVGTDLIGIDLGSFYLNLNVRDGLVHSLWMRHPVAKNALERMGFHDVSP